jgi:hypothetical protein
MATQERVIKEVVCYFRFEKSVLMFLLIIDQYKEYCVAIEDGNTIMLAEVIGKTSGEDALDKFFTYIKPHILFGDCQAQY